MNKNKILKPLTKNPDKYLFRGKRVDNGEWVIGYLSFIYVDGKNEKGFIYTNKARIFSQENNRSYDVYTETVGQCTGLKDKNGKLIFENDVVNADEFTGIVIWLEYSWRIFCKKYNANYYLSCIKDIEITGTIHDEAK